MPVCPRACPHVRRETDRRDDSKRKAPVTVTVIPPEGDGLRRTGTRDVPVPDTRFWVALPLFGNRHFARMASAISPSSCSLMPHVPRTRAGFPLAPSEEACGNHGRLARAPSQATIRDAQPMGWPPRRSSNRSRRRRRGQLAAYDADERGAGAPAWGRAPRVSGGSTAPADGAGSSLGMRPGTDAQGRCVERETRRAAPAAARDEVGHDARTSGDGHAVVVGAPPLDAPPGLQHILRLRAWWRGGVNAGSRGHKCGASTPHA